MATCLKGVALKMAVTTKQSELLVITGTFQIPGVGLIVIPDFPVPAGGWRSLSETATIIRPDGHKFDSQLNLQIAHFNIRDLSVSADRRWRVVPCFRQLTKEEVPLGSHVFVCATTVEMLIADVVQSPLEPADDGACNTAEQSQGGQQWATYR